MNIEHTITLKLEDATFYDLVDAVEAVPAGAVDVRISTSTVVAGSGYGEYSAVTLKITWTE